MSFCAWWKIEEDFVSEEMAVKKVLITGAAGLVGGILRSHWGDRYTLLLADIHPVGNLAAHETFVKTDIVEYEQVLAATASMDTVVHLAAYPGDGAEFYDTLLKLNIIGTYNAFHAAQEAGCRRIVFTSSIDAVNGYAQEANIESDRPVYPTSVYGASKCWGEALGRVYTERREGLSCVCVRLTHPTFDQGGDWESEAIMSGTSPRDCAQLFGRCVDVEEVDFAIVSGISDHRYPRLALNYTRRLLGYLPQDGTAWPKG